LFRYSMPMSPRIEKVKVGEKYSNDETWCVYTISIELLYCDYCTSTFHSECLAIKVLEGS